MFYILLLICLFTISFNISTKLSNDIPFALSSSYMNYCIIMIFNRITHTFIQLTNIG